jgi:uncharacterized protein YwgA
MGFMNFKTASLHVLVRNLPCQVKLELSLICGNVFFRHALSEGNQKQREIKTLKRDLDKKDDDLGETSRLRDAVARENKRVQEDLVTMTSENQVSEVLWSEVF